MWFHWQMLPISPPLTSFPNRCRLVVKDLAVAEELDLPRSWQNEQSSTYLPSGVRSGDAVAFHGAALRVTLESAELLS